MMQDMDGVEGPVAVVARLWEEHQNEPWDRGWNDLEVAGVDLVSLDTRLGGCTYTWVANGGSLHERGMATVGLILGQLETILPELTEDDSPHVWHRLHLMAQLIMAHNTPPAEASS
ncbi:hypothetical protein PUR71_05560 [Streptomyces sp. SP17BM10]|uniref:hypothetical protein n=1 Tax=Streptomyces sp. SP17BM10 TaxID=3002530 RepID=UPI002E78DB0F|nr:hypothetical protein [Streptomyces sp. SP17BM10]MEE1782395.1 hypothetical protein [Streptomyces sp. SP17BM10]